MKAAQRTGTDPAVMAAAGSVLLSWFFFYLRGNRESGIFVGLWPPTILAFASYFEQTRMSDRLHDAVRGGRGVTAIGEEGGLVEQIKQRV